MITILVLIALLGALGIGALVGLHYRGFIFIGDRRQLDLITEQLQTEHRMGMATSEAIAQMRAAVRDQIRRGHPS